MGVERGLDLVRVMGALVKVREGLVKARGASVRAMGAWAAKAESMEEEHRLSYEKACLHL